MFKTVGFRNTFEKSRASGIFFLTWQTLSGAPSPTVNTKEAMRLVMGMFNGSLDLDKTSQTTDTALAQSGHADPRPAGRSFKVVFLRPSLSITWHIIPLTVQMTLYILTVTV